MCEECDNKISLYFDKRYMLPIQRKIASMVKLDESPESIERVGGVDCAYVGNEVVAVCGFGY